MAKPIRPNVIPGCRYGRFVIYYESKPAKNEARQVVCKCDCGKTVSVSLSRVVARINPCNCNTSKRSRPAIRSTQPHVIFDRSLKPKNNKRPIIKTTRPV